MAYWMPGVTMDCPKCGAKNPDGQNYCGNCAASLDRTLGAVREYVDGRLPGAIKAAIQEQLKDQKVLEIETSWAVASRVTDWMKLLVFLLAFPLVILTAFGIKSYLDVMQGLTNTQGAAQAMATEVIVAQGAAHSLATDVVTARNTFDTVQASVNAYQGQLVGVQSSITDLQQGVATNSTGLSAVLATQATAVIAVAANSTAQANTANVVATSGAQVSASLDCPAVQAGDTPGLSVDLVPVSSCWPGRPYGDPIALTLHSLGGTLAGARFYIPSPQNTGASIHFAVGLDGQVVQFVALKDRAWSDGTVDKGSGWDVVCTAPAHLSAGIRTSGSCRSRPRTTVFLSGNKPRNKRHP